MRNEEVIPVELVRKELNQILNFGEISNAPILSKFLQFITEQKLLGHENELKEYTIGVIGLGKPNDFNPQLDAYVRIHAGRLRQVLYRYYEGPGINDEIVIDVPKGSYVPVFRLRGSQAGSETFPVEDSEKSKPTNGTSHAHENGKPVLAVLPFHNLSSENSKDYFVAGIGEQLSTDLARFQNLSVISYYTTYKYDSALKDLQEMKKTVAIDYVLTGSVRFNNDMVRLNVQLVLASTGEIVFTENYSRHLTPENIFDIQEEIVTEVLNMIADDNGIIIMHKAHASAFSKTENLSVQEAIYKYFDFISDFDFEKFPLAVEALEKAVATEPNNALASALLSGLYTDSYVTKIEKDEQLLQKATDLAHAAVRFDPQCQHAQKVLAWVLLLANKKQNSIEAIERCIKLNPKASSIISAMALAYICNGEYTQAFRWLLETIHLSPVVPGNAKFSFAIYYFHTKDYSESLKWLDRLSPLETPFLLLFRQSLLGKLNHLKPGSISKAVLDLKPQAANIIGRMILDPELKNEIIHGLKVGGLTVK
jgi:TolB-like protein